MSGSGLKVNMDRSEVQRELDWCFENRNTKLSQDFIRVLGQFNRDGDPKTYFELQELKKRIKERM